MSSEVNAIVSTGSMDRPISLPGVERVVGGDTLLFNPETGEEPRPAKGPLELNRSLPMFRGGGTTTGFSRAELHRVLMGTPHTV